MTCQILTRRRLAIEIWLLISAFKTPSKMIISKPTLTILLLATHTVAQSCTLDFYFNLVGEFDCGGSPLVTAHATATSCVDISTITLPVVGKHWNAFKGENVPVGCSGLSLRLADSLHSWAAGKADLDDSRCIC